MFKTEGKSGNQRFPGLGCTAFLSFLILWSTGNPLSAAASSKQSQSMPDQKIALALEEMFSKNHRIPDDYLDIKVREGIVKLSGQVNNLLAQEHAVAVTETIKGVRGIVNTIKVNPLVKTTDNQLRSEIIAALTMNPATESYEIDVQVDDGRVTLTGRVQSWQEKQLAAQVVKGVRAVKQIRNDLVWESVPLRSDDEIFHDISSYLKNDPWVAGNPITVQVNNGRVELLGTVGSLDEQRRIRGLAWVSGVKIVDASNLEIDGDTRQRMKRSPYESPPSDEAIRESILDSLAYDPRVQPFESTIIVEDGSVTLLGIVDNLQSKKAVAEDARNTIGVWHIRNFLKVRPTEQMGDPEIKSNIAAGFLRDPFIERHEIEVQVKTGRVYLTGSVDFDFERSRAESIASSVKGVIGVLNHVTVDTFWTWRPDQEIHKAVTNELWWSPFVDSDQVSVKVENGVATLTGTVDTWLERSIASENAYEGGAQRVINRLKVKHFKSS